jgi:hypothetical protein
MFIQPVYSKSLLCVLFMATSSCVRADLPLTVEDLITDKGKFKLDLSVAYANADRQGVFAGEPVVVQTGATSFVTLPTLVGESALNSDAAVATMGLRYGLSSKAEIYARLSGIHSQQRSSSPGGPESSRESGFADAWAGVNFQFKTDDDTPAVLGFAEVALREKHRAGSAHFKSVMLGLTTYKAIDPVVFSLTGAYRFSQSRVDGNQRFKPGNFLLIHPAVAFAVNDRVTLTTGVQWTRRQADRFTGQAKGIARTATDLLLGVGFGFAKGNMLNTTLKINASGRSGAELRTNWMYTF